jgi:hypothetical protein
MHCKLPAGLIGQEREFVYKPDGSAGYRGFRTRRNDEPVEVSRESRVFAAGVCMRGSNLKRMFLPASGALQHCKIVTSSLE